VSGNAENGAGARERISDGRPALRVFIPLDGIQGIAVSKEDGGHWHVKSFEFEVRGVGFGVRSLEFGVWFPN
jgi:hypothetical protein